MMENQCYSRIQLVAFFLVMGFCSQSFAGAVSLIQKNDLEVVNTIRTAQACMPSISTDRIRLCSGSTFERKAVNHLKKMDRATCQKEIEERGYRVLFSHDSAVLSESSWNEFVNSTKRAETLQKEKAVLFRPFATVADCIHEWVHVNQYVLNTTDRLNPVVRDKRMAAYEADLEKAAAEVERLEKNKQGRSARAVAELLEKHLEHLKAFWGLHQTLDEKDPHVLVLHGCRNWWTCSDDDLETAIANLVKLKEYLSSDIREEVLSLAKTIIQKKEVLAFKKIEPTWKAFSTKDKHYIARLLDCSTNEIADRLKDLGIALQSVETGKEPSISRKKSVCELSSGTSDKVGMIDAGMITIQFAANPLFCDALTLPKETEQQFNEGRISKTQFETRTLEWRAVELLAKYERLSLFLSYCNKLPVIQCKQIKTEFDLIDEKLKRIKNSNVQNSDSK